MSETAAKAQRWRERLADLAEPSLPTDYPRPAPARTVEASAEVELSEAASLAVLRLSLGTQLPESRSDKPSGSGSADLSSVPASPFAVLLAATLAVLMRHSGEGDLVVVSSAPSANPLPLRVRLRLSDDLPAVVAAVAGAEASAAADELPFLALVESIAPATLRPLARFFNLTDTSPATLEASAAPASADITVFISQAPTLRRILPISMRVVYNALLFSAARIADLLDQLQTILIAASANPSRPIGAFSLVTKSSALVLPDPRADLHWDAFEGAITDIFASNASAHPSRTCIVEHLPVPQNDDQRRSVRSFSYAQINGASNVLAHGLINAGVQREDVVVLYSYRSVDLVVAIMGVLKAGATFSVIDPAYPPPRQIVYLSVAKPRALVVLAKAGKLDEKVQEYIRNDLSIICDIPALQIHDDGSLSGGSGSSLSVPPSTNEIDVLASVASLANKNPDVVLGPDSIGTLSFTSGSTGIPKGVRGRHYSLTHFYPWMKQEFGLDEHDRFTMLSGIAHDPIQRDIFTPLFLGASLCIPTAEDIGSPGRLAEWMADQHITITHLTPAMGQLLSANASHPIPSLRHAFFVGDVLTKRDVLRLQHLAPNTHVINMYGTTETQRAVSYLKIPPVSVNPGFLTEQKDIMPAGIGMRDVQLLVINANGLLCGVGEVGELYVRSGGLAEGYLALPDVTSTKFLPNPFNPEGPSITEIGKKLTYYLGPRDRMYRTGDLGRYRPDGSVECTGRADDQVKIRGFRIELGEIDTHLSQHPDVRENVTLVRRDKDEEMTLVSYFVPLNYTLLENAAEMIKDIRNFLKQKLPSYAVPTVFVPLTRMPLTPNGKVDKNALPFPDTALAGPAESADSSELTSVQKALRDLWAQLLNVPATSIGLEDSFFELGGHSIMATRLVFEIRRAFAADTPLGMVYQYPSLGLMARAIDHARGGDLALAGAAATTADEGNNEKVRVSRTKSQEILPQPVEPEFKYAAELDAIDDPSICPGNLPSMDMSRLNAEAGSGAKPVTFFLTGATGFLGAFILSAVLKRYPSSRVICLVRAASDRDGLARVIGGCQRHLVWDHEWTASERVSAVAGDLAAERFGLTASTWDRLARDVDIIIHNGALVHWVYPYPKLHAPNVLGTKTALRLATTHSLKPLHFVSSTSVLDTDHYVRMLDIGQNVSESDDLEGSRTGLRSGYGQTKWVAEKLVMRAHERGVPATIIRPGYIVGDSHTGVTNVDDFLWRLVKGCIQLGKVPRISNVVNMCSVDYVAGAVAEIASTSRSFELGVFHIWNGHRFRFDDMFSSLLEQGYNLEQVEYIHWRTALMDLTMSVADNALYPLLHFVLDDLPTSTKSPELSDDNTCDIIAKSTVVCPDMRGLMNLYFGYLGAVGFIEPPPTKSLMHLDIWNTVRGQSIARTGN